MGVPPVNAAVDPERALVLHREARLFDGHNDLALRLFEGEDPARRREGGHLDLPRMREGGYTGGVFAVWIDPTPPDPLERTVGGLRRLREWVEATPGIRPILRAADFDAAAADDEIAAVLGVEGGYALGEDLDVVDHLFDLGMRCLTLTWMQPTAWADASGAPPVHGGLSAAGRRGVERLRRLGIAVDVSHASDGVVRELTAAGDGEEPLIASHSAARTVCDHPRNLPDPLLEAVARTGGVVGVPCFSAYLDEGFASEYERLRARFAPRREWKALDRALAALPEVPLRGLTAHVRHVLSVAGPAHVGLGTDFDGMAATPEGLEDATDLPRLTAALLADGIDAATVRAFLGANFRRCFARVLP